MVILFLALASMLGWSSATVNGLRPYFITAEMNLMEVGLDETSAAYSASLDGRYEMSFGTVRGYGRLLRTGTKGDDNSRNWLGEFRYEHNLFGRTTRLYYFHQIESDPFAGIVQRDSDEVGIYHVVLEDKDNLWTAETGLRYMRTNAEQSGDWFQNAVRFQAFYQRRFNTRISADIEAEYILNISDAHMNLVNGQLGIGSSLTPKLFIKLNYLVQYQQMPFANAKDTSTFTTLNLIAQF